MEFHNYIYTLSDRVLKNKDRCLTEEATKTSLILPFFTALGYDTSDPRIVIPEVKCAIRGAERIDYVLASDGAYLMLVECKHWRENLDNHVNQIEQYYHAGLRNFGTRIGVLTNGIEWRFFADIEKQNMMDAEPFFVFDISMPTYNAISQLKMFRKDDFDVQSIVCSAAKMIMANRLHNIVDVELSNPSDRFVDFFWNRLGTCKKLSKQQRAIFSPMVKAEIDSFIYRTVENQLQLPNIDVADCECTFDLSDEERNFVGHIYDILQGIVVKERLHLYRNRWGQLSIRLDNNKFYTICKLNIVGKEKWLSVSRYCPKLRKFYNKDSFRLYINTPESIMQYSKDLKDTLSLMLMTDNDERKAFVELLHKDWLD